MESIIIHQEEKIAVARLRLAHGKG